MELRRELLVSIGALVGLSLAFIFFAIGLFVRMGPAIERILQDNVYSIVAAEEVLAELAESGPGPLTPEATARVRASLAHAQQNVTESAERPALQGLRVQLDALAAGAPGARQQTVEALRSLIRVNREAMQRVDEDARRMGNAGAWAAVLVGFISFLLSLYVLVRLQTRMVRPLVDLFEVLEAVRAGNRLRRCRSGPAPREVERATQAVNWLLDERIQR